MTHPAPNGTTPAPRSASEEPRAKDQVWCPKLGGYTPRVWVADHLVEVHGVNRNMVIRAYGGTGSRRGGVGR